MSHTPSPARRERLELAADGLLITAAITSLTIALGVLPVALGARMTGNVWIEALSGILFLAGMIVGPLIVWRLHGRRLSPAALIGGVLGGWVTGLVLPAIGVLAWLLSAAAKPFSSSEYAGPIALAVLVGVAFLAACVWLVIDAARDMVPERRSHRRLDIGRFVAFLWLVAYGAGYTVIALGPAAGDSIDDPAAFPVLGGVVGMLVVLGADIAQTWWERRKAAPAPAAETSTGATPDA